MFNEKFSYMKEARGGYDAKQIEEYFTDDLADEILEGIAEGNSLVKSAEDVGLSFHHLGGLLRNKKLKIFQKAFLRAFEHVGWNTYDRMQEAEEKLITDKNVSTKRQTAILQGLQWRLQRLKPKTFGSKEFKQINSSLSITIESSIPEPKLLDDAEVIDAEVMEIS